MQLGARPAPGTLSICAIVKNEARYLPEWIEYHLMIGVEHFYLYDNGSEDDIGAAIAPFGALVSLIDWPMRGGQQKLAYQDYLRRHADDYRWTAFLDADEFICYRGEGALADFLGSVPPALAGLEVPWIIFGTNGHVTRPDALVLEAYTRAHSVPPQDNVKTVCRAHWVDAAALDSPHCFPYRGERTSARTGTGVLSICHYMLRSRQDVAAKVARGDAWSPETERKRLANQAAAVKSILDKYDAPDVDERCMLRHVAELKRRLTGRWYGAGAVPGRAGHPLWQDGELADRERGAQARDAVRCG